MAAGIWFVLLIFFIVVEASTVSVVSLWFAAGALAALVAALLHGGLWLQIGLFALVSVGMLLALRPVVRKHFTPKLTRTNVDAVIGTEGFVTEPIDNISSTGQVKLGAMEWTARSTGGDPIPAGTRIKVDKIEGVKVFVTPVEIMAQVLVNNLSLRGGPQKRADVAISCITGGIPTVASLPRNDTNFSGGKYYAYFPSD